MTGPREWKLIDVLNEATRYLESKSIENSRINAELLMAKLLSVSRIELYLQFDRPLNEKEREDYKILLKRRVSHEPLQYILGDTEFMSLPFRLNRSVMIPRPETEIVVESVLNVVESDRSVKILDIGTGCGNIAISLAKYLTGSRVVGIDISDKILAVARENSRLNGVEERTSFVLADIKKRDFFDIIQGYFDVVVSNPPYISIEEWRLLPREVRDYEPESALCDQADGLSFYRIIAVLAGNLLKSGGGIFFEVGDNQAESVKDILRKAGYTGIKSEQDLNGIERVVCSIFK